MTWQVVTVDRRTGERGLVWRSSAVAPIAEWYWLFANKNADGRGNAMPFDALAALAELITDNRGSELCEHGRAICTDPTCFVDDVESEQ